MTVSSSDLHAPRADIRTRFDYAEPKSVAEAVKILKEAKGRAQIIAAGQDMMGSLKVIPARPRYNPDVLVSINAIPGLDKIEAADGGVRIGPLVTLAALQADPLIKLRFPSLAYAVSRTATPQIQNRATLGGNLCQDSWCWYYRQEDWRFPCLRKGGDVCYVVEGDDRYEAVLDPGPCFCTSASDSGPVLMSLDAQVTIAGPDGTRTIPIQELFVHSRDNPRVMTIVDPMYKEGAETFITEIVIPAPKAGSKAVYLKQTLRAAWEHSKTGGAAAAVIAQEGGVVSHARIVLGGVSSVPYRVTAAEDLLVGKSVSEALLEQVVAKFMEKAAPMRENKYKIAIAKALIKRSVQEAAA